MPIHRVRLFHSPGGQASFHGWLGTWLTNMSPWADPEVSNDLPTERSPIDSDETYYRTEFAFEWSEDRSIILDQLDGYASAYCDWSRIGYHECSHDEDNATPCEWDEQRESGAVPDYILDMSPVQS